MDVENEAQRLSRLLVKAAAAATDLAARKGLEVIPQQEYSLLWFEAISEGRSEGRQEVRTEPDVRAFFGALDPELQGDEAVKALHLAAGDFVDTYGIPATGLGWFPEWIAGTPLSEYFRRIGKPCVDTEIAHQVCRAFVLDITGERVAILSTYQVRSFNAVHAFNLTDEVGFRPVNNVDIDTFCRERFTTLGPRHMLDTSEWICEVEQALPKGDIDAVNLHQGFVDTVAGALGVAVNGRATFPLLGSRLWMKILGLALQARGRSH